jgi:hypothetical protein
MPFGPNPSIWGEALRKELTTKERGAADREDLRQEQAILNAAELRDLEGAAYYGDAPTATAPEATPAEVHPSLLDRLLRRSR